ncbi:fatty acid-binding protein 1-like [Mizuhopecten yessoensis]|uniref:Uncharacterized protein n=1 Tax=Mizuhopecten yessoensis TaxID=6573 RepID=A0A210QPA6_MIZYE|nr:fatty acid-binding protein 1-like [Mizuhopecten yessoensis]OWF50569.1 hypothetical protein KP79_PYT18284 [Mizuhopecten yessoensis]
MSVFQGKWIDDKTTGESENFDGFCDAMGVTSDGKNMYKDVKMGIQYIVEGDTWTYDLTIGDTAQAYTLRIGVTNQEDVDMEGNRIVTTPTLEQPNKLVELTDTWLPSGQKVTTRMERTVVGDTMNCAITHLESGQTMTFNMTRMTS